MSKIAVGNRHLFAPGSQAFRKSAAFRLAEMGVFRPGAPPELRPARSLWMRTIVLFLRAGRQKHSYEESSF
jgi:hypothetical protein